MCSFFYYYFFYPTDPPTLTRGRAIGNETFFSGWPYTQFHVFKDVLFDPRFFLIGWDWRKNCGICINSFLTDYVQEQYNQTIRPTGELYLFGACFFCDDDTFRKTPVLLTRIHNRELQQEFWNIQPSWFCWDSPDFAWKSRITTNMRSGYPNFTYPKGWTV